MRRYVIILFFSMSFVSWSVEVPGLDSIDLTNRIELINISYDEYTSGLDTTYYIVSIYKDTNQKNIYLLHQLKSDETIIYFQDSTFKYNLKDKTYVNYARAGRSYLDTITQLIFILETKQVFLFRSLANGETTSSTIYNNEERTVNFSVKYDPEGGYFVGNKFNISFKQNRVDFLFESSYGVETIIIPELRQIFSPCTKDSIFKILDQFYKKDRFEFRKRVTKKSTKVKTTDLKIGQKINVDYKLIGINRANSTIKELFQGKDYLVLYNWGVWCGYCRINKQFVDSLYLQNYPKFSFVTINCETNESNNVKVKKYIEINKIGYPIYQSCEFLRSNGILGYPRLTIIDKNFKVIDIFDGNVLEYSEYENFLKKNKLIE